MVTGTDPLVKDRINNNGDCGAAPGFARSANNQRHIPAHHPFPCVTLLGHPGLRNVCQIQVVLKIIKSSD